MTATLTGVLTIDPSGGDEVVCRVVRGVANPGAVDTSDASSGAYRWRMALASRTRPARVTSATRSLRPLAITATIATGSMVALVLAVHRGWLGPDVGRGSGFCEWSIRAAVDPSSRVIRQPANTWSNLGFVLAGLANAWHAGRRDRLGPALGAHPVLATVLGVVVTLLGPASAAMHATQSDIGGQLDMLSMYLIAALAVAYAVTRLLRRGTATFAAIFLGALALCEVVDRAGGPMRVLMHTGNLAFAVVLVSAVGIEVALGRRGDGVNLRWGALSLATFGLAFGIWNLGKSRQPWCDPDSVLQPHALWHLLCAVAAYALYRAYAGAPSATRQDVPYADSRLRPSPA